MNAKNLLKKGLLFGIVTCIYSMLEKDCPALLWPNMKKAEFILAGFKEVTRANNQDLLVTIMASPDQAVSLSGKEDRIKLLTTSQPQRYFRDFLHKENINYLDFLPALSERNAQNYFFKQDGHLNRNGHEKVARELVKYLHEINPSLFPKLKS